MLALALQQIPRLEMISGLFQATKTIYFTGHQFSNFAKHLFYSKLPLNAGLKSLHRPKRIIMKPTDDKTDALTGVGASSGSAQGSRVSWADVQAAVQANNPSAVGSGLQQRMSEDGVDPSIQSTQRIFGDQQIEQVSKEQFKALFDHAMSLLPLVQKMIQQQVLKELKGPMVLNPSLYASADGSGHPTVSPVGNPNGTGGGLPQGSKTVDYKNHAPTGPQSVERPDDRFRGSKGGRLGLLYKNKK
jgi:hypothetical protein